MQMSSRGAELNPWRERWQWLQVTADRLLVTKHVANLFQRKPLAQVHRRRADLCDGGQTHFIQQRDGQAKIFWS